MTALIVPGSFSLPAGWSPARYALASGNGTPATVSIQNTDQYQRRVVLGVDATVGSTVPGQDVNIDVYGNGCVFYHDTQNPSESNGVCWAWRGMFYWYFQDTFNVTLSGAASGSQYGILIWGIVEGDQSAPPR